MSIAYMQVAFSNLEATESYMGQDTGRYSIVGTLDDENAESLSSQGVKLKVYEGAAQRKFASKFKVRVIDAEGNPFIGEIPRGSKIKLSYKTGDAHPVHGTPTYLNAIRVLELAEDTAFDDEL